MGQWILLSFVVCCAYVETDACECFVISELPYRNNNNFIIKCIGESDINIQHTYISHTHCFQY